MPPAIHHSAPTAPLMPSCPAESRSSPPDTSGLGSEGPLVAVQDGVHRTLTFDRQHVFADRNLREQKPSRQVGRPFSRQPACGMFDSDRRARNGTAERIVYRTVTLSRVHLGGDVLYDEHDPCKPHHRAGQQGADRHFRKRNYAASASLVAIIARGSMSMKPRSRRKR